jgi:hypothetical protein
VLKTDTWDSAGCDMSRTRQSHSCSDRIVPDECLARPCGTCRYRAAPSVAGPRQHGPSGEGTVPDEHGRHRPLQADVHSCSSVPSLSSVDVPNGQVVERARGGVQLGFGDVQVAGGSLQIAVTE